MKIGITGASGRIGSLLIQRRGCFPLNCDITIEEEVERAIDSTTPDVIVHLAALTDVDFCEKNTKVASKINYEGTLNVVRYAEKRDIGVVLISSDHIFDGKQGNYKEDYKFVSVGLFGSNYHKPVNYYGLSKLTAEMIQFSRPNMKIVRTSYLFDKERLKLEESYPTFIYRSFMYLPHFVDSLYEYTTRFPDMPKILHLSGSQIISWAEFSKVIFGKTAVSRNKESNNKDFAPRPHKCGLNVGLSKKLGFKQYSYLDGIWSMQASNLHSREL